MKIKLQNKRAIIEMPREIWLMNNEETENASIVCSSEYNPIIGIYKNEARAREVLSDMFDALRTGKNSYILPVE